MTFELMTPKYNQFIGSARYIHVLRLMVICPSVLMMWSRAILCIHNEPCDLWPCDPKIWSIHWLCNIHTWPKFGRNPSISSWDNTITSYFCIHNEHYDSVKLWRLLYEINHCKFREWFRLANVSMPQNTWIINWCIAAFFIWDKASALKMDVIQNLQMFYVKIGPGFIHQSINSMTTYVVVDYTLCYTYAPW